MAHQCTCPIRKVCRDRARGAPEEDPCWLLEPIVRMLEISLHLVELLAQVMGAVARRISELLVAPQHRGGWRLILGRKEQSAVRPMQPLLCRP